MTVTPAIVPCEAAGSPFGFGAAPVAGPGCHIPAERQPFRVGGNAAGALNLRIPPNPALHAQSTAISNDLRTSLANTRFAVNVAGPPLYMAKPTDLVYRWVSTDGGIADQFFRAPAGMSVVDPEVNSDMPLIVHDPVAGKYMRCFLVSSISDTPRGSGLGGTVTANAVGVQSYGRSADGWPWDAGWGTGCGLSSHSGLITGWEVKRGVIEHALRTIGPNYTGSGWVAPAQKSDQSGYRRGDGSWWVIPRGGGAEYQVAGINGGLLMGHRFFLDATYAECDARTVPGRANNSLETRWLRMCCRALKDYGMVIEDGSGGDHLYGWTAEYGYAGLGTADWASIIGTGNAVGGPGFPYCGTVFRSASYNGNDGITRSSTDGVPWGQVKLLASATW